MRRMLFFISLIPSLLIGQSTMETAFGVPTPIELNTMEYKEDPEASAVITFDKGFVSFKVIHNQVRLVKTVHRKIKVIDAQSFKNGEVAIYFYTGKESNEKIENLKAITHNGELKSYVNNDAIYTVEENEYVSSVKFAFSNIKDGSLLEYTYEEISPYYSSLNGWAFQNEYPTLYSEFSTLIPGNYVYNKSLYGGQKLDLNEATLKRNCFSIPGLAGQADCEYSIYVMKDIPAFLDEKYMLARKNYIARVDYEIKSTTDFKGNTTRYTKTWKDVDNEFKNDKDIGRQLKKNTFFEDKIPSEIASLEDSLEKAKAIYSYIQNYYQLKPNGNIYDRIRVKEAYEEKIGSAVEINLSLINMLQSAGFESYLVLISTRENGVPKESIPTLQDFNYAIALLKMGNQDILLDATSENAPFGLLPFKALNVSGRVMDFKKGSYSIPLEPYSKNIHYVSATIKANEDLEFTGEVQEVFQGYMALGEKNKIGRTSLNSYIADKASKKATVEVFDISIENNTQAELPLKLNYNVKIDQDLVGDKTYFKPYFFETYFKENPFKLESRSYPVELGFPVNNTYLIRINLDNKYKVVTLPKDRIIHFEGADASCSVKYANKEGVVTIRLQLIFNEYRFSSKDYQYLKDFFQNFIDFQTKEIVVLEKI